MEGSNIFKPAMSQILKPGESYYEFVVAVAKKAREISAEAEANKEQLDGKPVSLALELFATGEKKLSECNVHTTGNE